MILRDRHAILAVDPTPRGIGYVFFDRGEMLDWGQRRCGRNARSVMAFVDEILRSRGVAVLVLEDPDAANARRGQRASRLLRAMTKRVTSSGLEVLVVSRSDVRMRWAANGLTTKEVVAEALAKDFPELEPVVPPRRKAWLSEHPNVNAFDALTLLLHARN